MTEYSLLSIPIGYVLGSIPSSYIIGRMGKADMRNEGDGRISAAAVYRKLGRFPYALVLLVDIGKGTLSIAIAGLLTDALVLVLLTGFAAVVGHCWSVFMKFKGGLGATTICGVLMATVLWQLLMGLVVGALVMLATRKSGISSAIVIIFTTVVLLIQYLFFRQAYLLAPALITYPVALILVMVLKRLQTRKIREAMLETPEDLV